MQVAERRRTPFGAQRSALLVDVLRNKLKSTLLSSTVFLTLHPTFPLCLPQQTFKYLKTAVRIHLDVLSSGFQVPSSLNHGSRGMVWGPWGISAPCSKGHLICQCPRPTVAPGMKCNAPDVVQPLPTAEACAMISPLLGSVLRLIWSRTTLALRSFPHRWLTCTLPANPSNSITV